VLRAKRSIVRVQNCNGGVKKSNVAVLKQRHSANGLTFRVLSLKVGG
jgi:hypothetical protein